mmetsp:Transcript_18846/g.23879  ORF Transcript_18846/g.23879 Transcript_18846/m.23879 type:complete len:105 (+) Transcript_18846:802-1116(+)
MPKMSRSHSSFSMPTDLINKTRRNSSHGKGLLSPRQEFSSGLSASRSMDKIAEEHKTLESSPLCDNQEDSVSPRVRERRDRRKHRKKNRHSATSVVHTPVPDAL